MTVDPFSARSGGSASERLGQKLDSIPFSAYHLGLILVLGLVGFVEGYNLALSGPLIVLAKTPLHMTAGEIRFLAISPALTLVIGGFIASAISDHVNRKAIIQIGLIETTFFTLLIPVAQSTSELLVIRLLTGIGLGFAVFAPYPIAAELMPAQHRRTYGAIYEIILACAFTLLPFLSLLFAHSPNGFRLIALPGGLALFIVPALVHFVIPQSPRWQLRKGHIEAAVDTVNRIIHRCGNRVPPLMVAELGHNLEGVREELPPYSALFARGQLRWTAVGAITLTAQSIAYYLVAFLLPKALVDQGAAVRMSFGISTLIFFATIPGKAFIGYLMEAIGRRWTILYALAGGLPGLVLMMSAHLAGAYAPLAMSVGGALTGFTVLSCPAATRVYLSEQFPTALRGRGHIFGEAFSRAFAAVAAPFLMEPHTASPFIFFGTMILVVLVGAFLPILLGKETVGQIELLAAEIAKPLERREALRVGKSRA